MDLPWWSWIVIPAGVIFGVALMLLLLYKLLGPASEITGKIDRNKQIRAFAIVERYKIPNPPIVYCSTCGSKLDWEYVNARPHYFGKHNPQSGNEWFVVVARYICPYGEMHNLGSAYWGAVYWTEDAYGLWYWQTPFTLTPIKTNLVAMRD